MVRKERLELSHPKILVPKTSASTNSATLAKRKRLYSAFQCLYNLNKEKSVIKTKLLLFFNLKKSGVGNGTRTHDDRHHKPGLYQLSYTHHKSMANHLMARLAGLEPATYGLEGCCSIQLSYRRNIKVHHVHLFNAVNWSG